MVDGKSTAGLGAHSLIAANLVGGDLDPETYRHVATVYSISMSANLGGDVTMSGSQQNIRYTIEERFGDFEAANGITLPRLYDLRYTQELQNGSTRAYDWDMNADQVRVNVPLDPGNFRVH